MTTNTHAGGNELTNLALAALAALLTLSAVLRLAANVAAFLTGRPMPDGGPATGLKVLTDPAHPGTVLGDPDLNPFVYWIAVVVMASAAATAAWFAWRMAAWLRTPSARRDHRAGLASSSDLARTGSRHALVKRSTTLRPSLDKAAPADVGYLLGHARGRQLWASVEDSMLVLGPPRSGKGLHLVINMILDAPGAVVTTSTRPDTLAVTIAARQQAGPVAVFDPQGLADDVGTGLRWSPIRGCETPRRAMVRAAGLAKETGLGGRGVENGGFWENTTRGALQAMLHAAALGGRTPKDLYLWSLSPAAAQDAVAILRAHPAAAHGWGDGLDGMINGDPRTRDSLWMGVGQALACLADPAVLAAVSPDPNEVFNPETFLRERGTLYLLATGSGASASSALVAALIEDLTETARRLAARSPGQRLDPPLLLALDEIGNITPLPSLRFLMADGGGTGITTVPVFNHSHKHATNGDQNPPPRSGTPPSSRSSSVAPPRHRTCGTCLHCWARRMRPRTHSPSVTTGLAPCSGHYAGYPCCRPRRSAPSRSAPDWCCCARRRRSWPVCGRGPGARTRPSFPPDGRRSRPGRICVPTTSARLRPSGRISPRTVARHEVRPGA
ncbi:type IV secretory system conjugative DNA transfer VirD4/TraG family protein [Myceligenerans xiligouense]|uniref:Type IV secretory system conjugative DNA transfer VirD4/TraG family protein n=1 Tax=Myceligenerans xiligouense TaxID=253184 RepID=A0A3N4YPP1_9MICO|nr:type IV secretory system conjugative DNA transfer VirD4/TraG family protein [Myceligenerans xiligouense]